MTNRAKKNGRTARGTDPKRLSEKRTLPTRQGTIVAKLASFTGYRLNEAERDGPSRVVTTSRWWPAPYMRRRKDFDPRVARSDPFVDINDS